MVLSKKKSLIGEDSSGRTSPSTQEKSSESLSEVCEYPLQKQDQPLIETGADIAEFIIDVRDDGDACLTFRSILLGTIFAGLASSLGQLYMFKPHSMSLSPIFLQIVIYVIGNAWATFLPKQSWIAGGPLEILAPFFRFLNPGPFTLKEHAVATLLAVTSSRTKSAMMNFAVQKLFYDSHIEITIAVLATFSAFCFGFGLVGVLRPLTIYPSEMVYWHNLPTVTIFQVLHFDTAGSQKRMKLFWMVMGGIFCYEIIPAYIFPLLNGVSIFCLVSQSAPPKTRDVFTNIFGGADANEGLGLFSLSFDWQYIGSQYMSLPLSLQANAWAGHIVCYIAIITIYYTNTWKALSFPMLSSSIFSPNGTVYQQRLIFDSQFRLNETALEEYGLPSITGSQAWGNLVHNLAVSGMIVHVLLFWGPSLKESFKLALKNEQPDIHYQAMKKYKEVPWWWYAMLLVLSFFIGLVVVIKGQISIEVWSYVVALAFSALVAPFAAIIHGRLGGSSDTSSLVKMLAAAIQPGQPVANLYFSMWSHDVIQSVLHLSTDLKMGQYLKIPPRIMLLTQLWGTILGAVINYAVMDMVVDSKREILLKPRGTNVWSGQHVQSLNSNAVTWALAKQMYSFKGPYFMIPMGLLVGIVPTFVQWVISKRYPNIWTVKLDDVVLPIIYLHASSSTGITSALMSGVIVGILSQIWLRRYHRGWYTKYNYILGGALDGGTEMMVLILAFAVFGAAGIPRPFPSWAGNPRHGNVDYCNGNKAL